ncbi:MAG TPA: AsmA family protein [Bacteroidales bacterium]|nr:AsmA family protein [Bacteroidales bacterium]
MNKVLSIALKVVAAIVALIVVAAIVLPIVFKPQLMKVAKKEANSMLNAKVDFTDFQVSLIKGFPNLYVGMRGLSVVGIDSFANDTLVAFNEFGVKVNLWSVIDMTTIEVKSILLDGAKLKARVLPDGRVNWDIMKPSETPETEMEDTLATTTVYTKVALKKFEIRNASIAYIDDSSNMKATIQNLNLTLSGNMGMSQTDLNLRSSIESLNFWMDGIRYLKNASVGFDAKIGANLDSSYYTFKENSFTINQLKLLFDGSFRMPNNDIDINLNFKTPSTDFKALLSMIPAVYMNDFQNILATGKFGIEGYVRGIYNDTQMPNAFIALTVDNGMFKYPDLPKSVTDVNISTKIWFDGQNMDNTSVNVDRFALNLGGSPFSMRMRVATPISDMQVDGNITGKIDFATLADAIPMDSTYMEGLLESNLDFGGKLSFIEKEQYERFKADGQFKLSNFKFKSPDVPAELKINDITLNFTPRFVNLANFDMAIASSDIRMNGRLENFIPYVFKDETLSGNLSVYSNLLDVNELLTGESTPVEETTDTTALSVIELPKNINFTTKVDMKKIAYDKLDIENLAGNVVLSRGVADLKNLSMNMLQGNVRMSGTYDPRDVKAPVVNFDFDMRNIDIPTAFKSFTTIQKMAPAVKDMTGKVSTQLKFNSVFDTTMSPVLNSINAYGKLQSKNIGVSNSKVFAKLADYIKKEEFRNPSLKDVNVSFSIKNGRIYIEPFDTKIAEAKMNFGGDMGIDQSLNFKAKVSVPSSYLGGVANLANDLLGKYGAKLPPTIDVNLKILGTYSKPDIQIDTGGGSAEPSTSAKETAKEAIKEKVDEAKVEARQKAKAEADKLIADAEKEAEHIRAEAAIRAQQIRDEAEAQAKKTEEEGKKKGPIAERAAKEAAKKIRQNGEAAAQKVIAEADKKANAVIAKAKAKAEAAKLE